MAAAAERVDVRTEARSARPRVGRTDGRTDGPPEATRPDAGRWSDAGWPLPRRTGARNFQAGASGWMTVVRRGAAAKYSAAWKRAPPPPRAARRAARYIQSTSDY